jgi:hypothetical protein
MRLRKPLNPMQFLKPVARANKKARRAATRTGLKIDFSDELFTPEDSVLQPEQSI